MKWFALAALATACVVWALPRWVFGDSPAEAARTTAMITAVSVVPGAVESLRMRRLGLGARFLVALASALGVMVLWRVLGIPRGTPG